MRRKKRKIWVISAAVILVAVVLLIVGFVSRKPKNHVDYQDNVVGIPSSAIVSRNEEDGTIVIVTEMAEELSPDSIVLYDAGANGLASAGKVETVGSDGTIALSPVKAEEVISSLTVEKQFEITTEDIFQYYEGLDTAAIKQKNHLKGLQEVQAAERNGFSIELSSGDNQLNVDVTDKATKITKSFTPGIKVDMPLDVTVDVDRIVANTAVDFSSKELLKSARAEINMDSKVEIDLGNPFSGDDSGENEIRIPLFEKILPLTAPAVDTVPGLKKVAEELSVAAVDLHVYMVIAVDGTVSFSAEIPVVLGAEYSKGQGISNTSEKIKLEEPELVAEAEGDIMLRVEPVIQILNAQAVMDVEADIGVTISGEIATHKNLQICLDAEAAAPTLTVSVGGDDEIYLLSDKGKKHKLDTWLSDLGLSAEWHIIGLDDDAAVAPPFVKEWHIERLGDGTIQKVTECTYDESEAQSTDTVPNTAVPSDVFPNTYQTELSLGGVGPVSPMYEFGYPDGWELSADIFPVPYFGEIAVLTKDNMTICYVNAELYTYLDSRGTPVHMMSEWMVEKAADAGYTQELMHEEQPDMEYDGEYVVAKMTSGGVWRFGMADKYAEGGEVMYALLPVSDVGVKKDGEITPVVGYDEAIYPSMDTAAFFRTLGGAYCGFFVTSSDGVFTEDQEKEVVGILRSMREILQDE